MVRIALWLFTIQMFVSVDSGNAAPPSSLPVQDLSTPQRAAMAWNKCMWAHDMAGMKEIGIGDDAGYEELSIAFEVVVPAADDFAAALKERFGDAGERYFGGSAQDRLDFQACVDRSTLSVEGDKARLSDPKTKWRMDFLKVGDEWRPKLPVTEPSRHAAEVARIRRGAEVMRQLTSEVRSGKFRDLAAVEEARAARMARMETSITTATQPTTLP